MQMTPDVNQFFSRLGDGPEYSPKEVAACFGVNVSTVYRYIESGRLPAARLFGYRIRRDSLTEFINASSSF